MKSLIATVALVIGLGASVMAQGGGNEGPTTHFTIGVLEQMGKLELARIYVTQCSKLNMLLPYIPFNQKGDAVSLAGMGIPDTKDNNEFIKKLDSSGGSYNETLDGTLNIIVPYADKADIIKSILFLQSTIERIESGL
ncbi:MAG: hypothetical protein U0176_25015 [Bacteroidia bacterium]